MRCYINLKLVSILLSENARSSSSLVKTDFAARYSISPVSQK